MLIPSSRRTGVGRRSHKSFTRSFSLRARLPIGPHIWADGTHHSSTPACSFTSGLSVASIRSICPPSRSLPAAPPTTVRSEICSSYLPTSLRRGAWLSFCRPRWQAASGRQIIPRLINGNSTPAGQLSDTPPIRQPAVPARDSALSHSKGRPIPARNTRSSTPPCKSSKRHRHSRSLLWECGTRQFTASSMEVSDAPFHIIKPRRSMTGIG